MRSSTSNSDHPGELGAFIRRSAWFLFLLCVVLTGINAAVDAYRRDWVEDMFDEVSDKRVAANMVIFGSSHAAHGINPKNLEPLGYRVYNFAVRGATTPYLLDWYQQIFRPYYPKPEVVIFQVEWHLFSKGWGNRTLERDSEFFPFGAFMSSLRDGRYDRTMLFIRRFPMMKLRDEWRFWRKEQTDLKRSLAGAYHGYMPKPKGELEPIECELNLEPERIRAFETLLDELQSQNIQVVLVETPDYLPLLLKQEHMREQNRLIAEIAKKRGIVFLNYNEAKASKLNSDPEWFADTYHLNEQGAREFSNRLARDLEPVLQQKTKD